MLFNSIGYLLFLPLLVLAHWLVPHRFRWGLLLVASYYFYMSWRPEYGILLFLSTFSAYASALWLVRTHSTIQRRAALLTGLGVNLAPLIFYKYLGFLWTSANCVLAPFGWAIPVSPPDILLPVGISFFTFQAMSYLVDVYRGHDRAEPHLGYALLYVSFFPQLVAGPIERAGHLLGQLQAERTWSYRDVADGLKYLAWGLFKKVVIADRVSVYVNEVYGSPASYDGSAVVFATVFFTFQIYCDFSGYCDMAVGSARLMGVRLMRNFDCPYLATSVTEFWRRWHISLSTWFRDYVYVALGGKRCGPARWACNIMATFGLSGLWHGANWTFIVWGLYHGAALVLWRWVGGAGGGPARGILAGLGVACRWTATFAVVCVGWVFFRAQTLTDAVGLIGRAMGSHVTKLAWQVKGFGGEEFVMGAAMILLMLLTEGAHCRGVLYPRLMGLPTPVRLAVYAALSSVIVLFGAFEKRAFIYFQF